MMQKIAKKSAKDSEKQINSDNKEMDRGGVSQKKIEK